MSQDASRLAMANLLATLACVGCIEAAPLAEGGSAVRRLVFTDALNQPRDSFQVTVTPRARPDLVTSGRFAIACTSAEPKQKRKLRGSAPGPAVDEPCTSQALRAPHEVAATSYRLSLTPYYSSMLGLERPVEAAAPETSSSDLRPAYTMVVGFVQAGDLVEVHWGPP